MDANKLYNKDSIARLMGQAKSSTFTDSAGGLVLGRNLEAVDPTIFKQQFAGLSLLTSGLTIDNSGGYANSIRKKKLGKQGGFSYSGDKSANKGKITINAEDDSLRVYQLEAFSEWGNTEIEQAKMENINLVQEFLETTNLAYNQSLDSIGYLGHRFNDGSAKSEGLLNHAGFVTSSAGGAIDTLAGDKQYDAIASLITDQQTGVSNVEDYMANVVTMPTRVYNVISKTILNTASGSSSVLSALQANFAGVSFQMTSKADTVANGGQLTASATVAWSNRRNSILMRVPKTLEIGEIVKRGSFDFQMDSVARIGGLDVAEDGAGRILTGL